jgi:hypothetical protein
MPTNIPKYAKPKEVTRIFPLSHAQLYNLINLDLIKSHSLKLPGCRRGTRLIDTQSVQEFIESCPK